MQNSNFFVVEAELRQLIYKALRFYDDQDYERMLGLFTEDAHYFSNSRGNLNGKAEILAGISQRPKCRLVRHLMTNFIVELTDAETATGICNVIGAINDDGHPLTKAVPQVGPPAFGEYHFKFKRVGDTWKISEKVTVEVFWGMLLKP